MKNGKIRVCIIYPADPVGTIPGGIDTFIRGELKYAPADIEYSLVGITTDPTDRPVGRWTKCKMNGREFSFFPVSEHRITKSLPTVPITIRYMVSLLPVLSKIKCDVLEFHRVEPMLLFWNDQRPKSAVLHQNMLSLYSENSEIRWSRLPRLYFWLEDRLVPKLDAAFCIRSDAADYYRRRYVNLSETCSFLSTWADSQQFHPPSQRERSELRQSLATQHKLNFSDQWLIMVGRLVTAKNPMLLVQALRRLHESGSFRVQLLIVGEGPLRDKMKREIDDLGLLSSVRFLGPKRIEEVAVLLRAADLFVMSSAYEGMPMAVIEALASGVPVATTRVGEVDRVVIDGVCGRIAESHSEEKLTEAIEWCLSNLDIISGAPCTESASHFSPAVVLEPVYENYRRLAAVFASGV